MVWTTLGTNGGPTASDERAQPANLLTAGDALWLIDSGDGVSDQLAMAGVNPLQIEGVLISHLHPDHFGGLYALIARRWFLRSPNVLTVYGPPGIEDLVAGILASLERPEQVGLGLPENNLPPAAGTVAAITVQSGDMLTLGDVTVTAIENTHFEPDADTRSQSLSYRFERAGYAIGYTGDTGPSPAVDQAFAGVDMLVAEVIDMTSMTAMIERSYAALPVEQKEAVLTHLRTHHLLPSDIGQMARATGADEVVVTHIVAAAAADVVVPRISAELGESFDGRFEVADDLDAY